MSSTRIRIRGRVAALVRLLDPDGPDADVYWYTSRSTFARAAEAAAVSGDRAIEFGARAQLFECDIGHLAPVGEGALLELQEHARSSASSRSRASGTLLRASTLTFCAHTR